MRLVVYRSAAAAAGAAARDVAKYVATNPRAVLGLPTGRTPVPFYRALVRICQNGRVDLSRVHTFNLDEFVGIGADHPGSYHAYMRRRLFSRVHLPESHQHILDGAARSWRAEADAFERALGRLGGLDLAVLGIGVNGHLGFNEPAGALAPRTHRVRLSPSSRRANAWLFGRDIRAVPTHALSMGIGTLLASRRLLVLITGPTKARIARRAINGPVTTRVPASLVQLHPDCLVVVDRHAARLLHHRPR